MLFLIKSAQILKKNLIVNLSTIKKYLKIEINSYGDEATDFYNKEMPKVRSNHFCLAGISLDSALKKMKTIIRKFF